MRSTSTEVSAVVSRRAVAEALVQVAEMATSVKLQRHGEAARAHVQACSSQEVIGAYHLVGRQRVALRP